MAANYKLHLSGAIIRLDDGVWIPPSPSNLDWREYQKWLAAGNVPVPADPAPVPLDIADINNLDKVLKAVVLLTRQYANEGKVGTFVTKTVADTRADFMAIFRALP